MKFAAETITVAMFFLAACGSPKSSDSSSTEPAKVSVSATPSVLGVSPNSGSAYGNTVVAIVGSNFTANSRVFVAQTTPGHYTEMTKLFTIGTGLIYAVTPAFFMGKSDIIVSNSNTENALATGAFTFLQPTISGPPASLNPAADQVGLYSPMNNYFMLLPNDVESSSDNRFQTGYSRTVFNMPAPIKGNFDGKGGDTVGYFDTRSHEFFIRTDNSAGGSAEIDFTWGNLSSRTQLPVTGHWNGEKTDGIGLYDFVNSTFDLKNSASVGAPDASFQFGTALAAVPIAGDWDGDGKDSIGLYYPATGEFQLKNLNVAGSPDFDFKFGPINKSAMIPVVGDWDGDGKDTVGVFDSWNSILYIRNSNTAGDPDYTIQFQKTTWNLVALAGKWRPSTAPVESAGYNWPMSDPASQNVDPAKLDSAYTIARALPYTRSLLVIRHGTLVREEYFNGNRGNVGNNIASVSKSIMSACFGIAMSEGKIPSDVNTPVSTLLPAKYFPAGSDPRLFTLTLKNLMNMQSGLDFPNDQLIFVSLVTDFVDYITKQKFVLNPGTTFNYSTANNILGAHILTDKTGERYDLYAKEKLFDKLGIKAVWWSHEPDPNYMMGGADVGMRPRDMARFGYLYLNGGKVDGVQIVPEAWVRESTKSQVPTGDGRSYGYWWWKPFPSGGGDEVYQALGHGGQYITVIPSKDTVIIQTSRVESEGTEEQTQYSGARLVLLAALAALN